MSNKSQRSDGTDKSLKEIKEIDSENKSEKDDDEDNPDFERAQVRTRELKHRTNKESEQFNDLDVTTVPKIAILDPTGNFMNVDGSDDEEEKKVGTVGEGLTIQASSPKLKNEDSWF